MRTSDAVTSASGLEWGLVILAVVYGALTVGTVYALRVLARQPLPGPVTPVGTGPPRSGTEPT